METIKTACMVIVLMAIGYGVYTVLNQPEQVPPDVAGQSFDQLDVSLPDFGPLPSFGGFNEDSEPVRRRVSDLAEQSAPPFVPSTIPPQGSPLVAENSGSDNRAAQPTDNTEPEQKNPAQNSAAGGAIAWADHLDNRDTASRSEASRPEQNPPMIEAQTVGEVGPGAEGQPEPTYSQPRSIYSMSSEPDDRQAASPSATEPPASAESPGDQELASRGGDTADSFEQAWNQARDLLEQGDMGDALRMLTPWRNRPSLSPAQKEKLDLLLSQLAGTVIYSTEHVIDQPYVLNRGETLGEIARRYNVPTILLQRINGISNPDNLEAGTELKVLHGPFTATLDATNNELSLLVNGCYAGRFPVEVTRGNQLTPGQHQIIRKEENPEYFDSASGQIWKAGDERNPYGSHALHLDGGVVLHGDGGPGGSVGLTPRDVEDIFGILSVGSRVTITR